MSMKTAAPYDLVSILQCFRKNKSKFQKVNSEIVAEQLHLLMESGVARFRLSRWPTKSRSWKMRSTMHETFQARLFFITDVRRVSSLFLLVGLNRSMLRNGTVTNTCRCVAHVHLNNVKKNNNNNTTTMDTQHKNNLHYNYWPIEKEDKRAGSSSLSHCVLFWVWSVRVKRPFLLLLNRRGWNRKYLRHLSTILLSSAPKGFLFSVVILS